MRENRQRLVLGVGILRCWEERAVIWCHKGMYSSYDDAELRAFYSSSLCVHSLAGNRQNRAIISSDLCNNRAS